jgi:predicted phosphoribosyltransferase
MRSSAWEMLPGFGEIGSYYRNFHQLTDAEVTDLLARASPVSAAIDAAEP